MNIIIDHGDCQPSFQLYKRYDPTSSDEVEYMENLFNCLCSALMFHPNKDLFLKGEGLQLMILMLRYFLLEELGTLFHTDFHYIQYLQPSLFIDQAFHTPPSLHVVFICREKKMSRRSALKVLDYSMQGNEGAENCQKFIEFLGLRCLFPLFMKVQ